MPRRRDEAQTELFATPVQVERLDPGKVLGASTRVDALWRVRIGDGGGTHLLFLDRHGRYCQEHGRSCRALRFIAD
ncbi:MAG: hypothetical protein JWL60_2496 [Gemmatimonadetes bacterium]|jgi:hypothetical protein|nr:hypothetical protein [Gemmatimonadota bacterium]